MLRDASTIQTKVKVGNQGAVTNLGCPISDQRLRSFYFIKLYFKYEPSDLYLTTEIQNRVKLCAKSTRKSRPSK
jgi:hypothetical protein